jgi:hypothetical protein
MVAARHAVVDSQGRALNFTVTGADRSEAGKLYLFVAIDLTSKVAFAELHEKAERPSAARFLDALIAAVP